VRLVLERTSFENNYLNIYKKKVGLKPHPSMCKTLRVVFKAIDFTISKKENLGRTWNRTEPRLRGVRAKGVAANWELESRLKDFVHKNFRRDNSQFQSRQKFLRAKNFSLSPIIQFPIIQHLVDHYPKNYLPSMIECGLTDIYSSSRSSIPLSHCFI